MSSIAMGLGLWVPDEVREEILRAEDAGGDRQRAIAFRKQLKGIDPLLDIIWVKRGTTSFPVGGRWYIVRYGEHAKAKAFWVVQDDQGRYCPPTDQHLERLQAKDSHAHPDVWERMRRTREATTAASKKRMEETRREFREKLLERLTFNHSTQIRVKSDYAPKLSG